MRKLTFRKVGELTSTGWGYIPFVNRIVPRMRLSPLLVVSMPRSGSSWIGSVVGASNSAAYMREPFSAKDRRKRKNGSAIFRVDPSAVDHQHYRVAINQAMNGIPSFPHSVLKYPNQWSPLGRTRRRTVIKDINPLALPYLLEHYEFQTVFVVRHPVAIAESFSNLGWWDKGNVAANMERVSTCWSAAIEALKSKSHRVVRYEDVCASPKEAIQDLLDWVEIELDDRVSTVLEDSIGIGSRADTYSTVRDPKAMAEMWKQSTSQNYATAAYKAFMRVPQQYYTAQADWRVD